MNNKITPFGYFLIITFFILVAYSAWISSKSIDWNVLKRMEESSLTLPSPIPTQISTSSATPTTKK